MTSTIANAFARNTPRESRFPQIHGSVATLKNGTFHPPRKQAVDSAATMNMSPNSARKKRPKRIPEYSTL